MTRMIAVAIVLSCVLVAPLDAGDLLVNGSFETYSVAPANWWQPYQIDINIGPSSLSGWTVTPNLDIVSAGCWQVCDGNNSLDLCGTSGDGGISQTFSTVLGTTYDVRFFLSGNPSRPSEPTNKTLSVSAAGQSTSFSFDIAAEQNTTTNMKWKECNFSFTANSTSTTLSINATMGGNCYTGPVVDNVSVSPVPEPSTFALLAVAAVGLLAYARRKRRAA
jgi:choice-of-anchor C domain-containing protein